MSTRDDDCKAVEAITGTHVERAICEECGAEVFVSPDGMVYDADGEEHTC